MSVRHGWLQLASCAASYGKPMPAETVAELIRGGLACLTVANAEAASCSAARNAGSPFVYHSDHPPFMLRRDGARVIQLATADLPPLVARSLARQGLVPALLQVVIVQCCPRICTDVVCLGVKYAASCL